jgi:molecular chaperone HtpG
MTLEKETLPFQAETKRLLDLVIHSLYTQKEIFLRELVSNASDAVDALRFQALTKPELLEGNDKFEIHLNASETDRTFTISDNGIGMTRDEVVKNIGTIARSGTKELKDKLKENPTGADLVNLIGQFGVGFYSAFMVADKVTLVTRKAGEATATEWESSGDGQFTIRQVDKPSRGTSITLHLKPDNHEDGIDDYTDKGVLAEIVKKHSDFVAYPILWKGEEPDDKPLNSMKPIWTRPKSEVTDADYAEFYKHVTHDWDAPLKTITAKAEGATVYEALVFIPKKAPHDILMQTAQWGLRLYARRVLIMDRCEELLPPWLRFVKGIVDASDLPLNVSRQMLQQDRHVQQIRKWLTKKVLSALEEMRDKESETYLAFWKEFGRVVKEGVSVELENRDRVVGLALFPSSADPEKLTSLADYVKRMKEGQTEIYYLTGESRKVVENSPHLERLREKGHEVLYLVDPIDELFAQLVREHDGKKLVSAAKGAAADADKLAEKEKELGALVQTLESKLEEHVKKVRLTARLTKSPACLVGDEFDWSPGLERLMRQNAEGPRQKRILELNPDHPIVQGLRARFEKDRADPKVADTALLLFGYAQLAEGAELWDPVKFNALLADLLVQGLK